MPLLLVVHGVAPAAPAHERWLPLMAGASIGAIPIAVWGIARWQVDGSLFFERVFFQDFVTLSTTSLDGHSGSPLFYLNILVKHHYDWMVAALAAAILFPPQSWTPLWRSLRFWADARARDGDDLKLLLGAWVVITLLVPTLLQTKLPWYLNAFYPMFALGVGWALAYGFSRVSFPPPHHRWLLIAMILMASTVAEAKLIWYSYHYRGSVTRRRACCSSRANVFATCGCSAVQDRADKWVLKGLVETGPPGDERAGLSVSQRPRWVNSSRRWTSTIHA
jgi:hypothetical protein